MILTCKKVLDRYTNEGYGMKSGILLTFPHLVEMQSVMHDGDLGWLKRYFKKIEQWKLEVVREPMRSGRLNCYVVAITT